MKKILTFLLVFCSLFCFSQTKSGLKVSRPVPAVKPSPGKKYNSATTNAVNTLMHDTCLDKQFSIVFYIVLDSVTPNHPNYPGIGFATTPTLTLLMNALNDAFRPICVSFVNCSTVYIPNFTYGKTWKKNATESHVTGSYYTERTINFYVVDTVSQADGNTEMFGYTYEPPVTPPANLSTYKKDLLVVSNANLMNFDVTLHLLGHFFGLPHTFDEIQLTPPASPAPPATVVSQEFADGSNCYIHGDGFCDTDADPNNLTILQDGMGNYYLHPKDNLMSYYVQRCRFTQEQYNYMARTVAHKKLYLH